MIPLEDRLLAIELINEAVKNGAREDKACKVHDRGKSNIPVIFDILQRSMLFCPSTSI